MSEGYSIANTDKITAEYLEVLDLTSKNCSGRV